MYSIRIVLFASFVLSAIAIPVLSQQRDINEWSLDSWMPVSNPCQELNNRCVSKRGDRGRGNSMPTGSRGGTTRRSNEVAPSLGFGNEGPISRGEKRDSRNNDQFDADQSSIQERFLTMRGYQRGGPPSITKGVGKRTTNLGEKHLRSQGSGKRRGSKRDSVGPAPEEWNDIISLPEFLGRGGKREVRL